MYACCTDKNTRGTTGFGNEYPNLVGLTRFIVILSPSPSCRSTVAYTTRARLAWRRTRISSTPQPWPTRRLTASAVWGEGLRSPSGEQRPGDTTLPLFRRSLGHCSPWHDEILPLSRCDPIGGWFLGPLRSPNTRIILLRLPPSTNSAAARITVCRSALAAWADQTYSYIVICAALLAAAFPTLLLGNSIYSSILNSVGASLPLPLPCPST
jgi:hypothetical protein